MGNANQHNILLSLLCMHLQSNSIVNLSAAMPSYNLPKGWRCNLKTRKKVSEDPSLLSTEESPHICLFMISKHLYNDPTGPTDLAS